MWSLTAVVCMILSFAAGTNGHAAWAGWLIVGGLYCFWRAEPGDQDQLFGWLALIVAVGGVLWLVDLLA